MAHVLDFWPNLIDAICFTHPPSDYPEMDDLREMVHLVLNGLNG